MIKRDYFFLLVAYLQFKPEEITGIMNDFAEPGSLAPTGLFLGSTKYMVIQGEPGAVIRGKKVNNFFLMRCLENMFSTQHASSKLFA